ncbi:hypothetical protein J7J95_03105 [bacterium]|nr:hypothetical protein [bacterium]
MVKIRDLRTTVHNYVEKSLMTFINGGKYSGDKGRTQTLNWIMGIIRESGIVKEELMMIFSHIRTYPKNQEEQFRFNQVIRECQKTGFIT